MLAIENALSRVAGNRHAPCNSTKAGGNHVKEILHTFAFCHNNVYLSSIKPNRILCRSN